jgi:Tol biopolymer transport system component
MARDDVTSLNIRSLAGELVGVMARGRFSTASLSPDRGTLAVTLSGGDLTLVDVLSGGTRRYQADPREILDASWSPDGGWLAVTAYDEGTSDSAFIAVLDAGTLELTRVTFGQRGERAPSWSPDGNLLAYEADAGESVPLVGVFLLGMDCMRGPSTCEGAAVGPLGQDADLVAFSPSWPPDGQDLSAVCSGGQSGFDSTFLCTIRLSDGHIEPISPYPDTRITRWSPDGQWIAFEKYGDTLVVRPDGKDETIVAEREEVAFWLELR